MSLPFSFGAPLTKTETRLEEDKCEEPHEIEPREFQKLMLQSLKNMDPKILADFSAIYTSRNKND